MEPLWKGHNVNVKTIQNILSIDSVECMNLENKFVIVWTVEQCYITSSPVHYMQDRHQNALTISTPLNTAQRRGLCCSILIVHSIHQGP